MSCPKRIILLCDGTGNSASRSHDRSTNVKRLTDLLAQTYKGVRSKCRDPTHPKDTNTRLCTKSCPTETFTGQQVLYYQSGVGTSKDMGELSVGYSQGTGSGINDNILDAYCWLANNYRDGDEIFIFGFSRGAFTARVVANLVIQLGLFWRNRMYMLPLAWAQYSKKDHANWEYFKTQLWSKHYFFTRPVSIRVLGVWDTVGAVGTPDYMPEWMNSQKFHQSNVLNGIDYVFHVLALDEYRRTFGPTLFYLPDQDEKNARYYKNRKTGELEKFPDNKTILKQTWLAGAHSNVGGSYPSEHIADISLGWMLDQLQTNGKLLAFDEMAVYLMIERHLNPAKNIANLYKDDPGDYPGWGLGSVYNSFNGKSNSIDFITYKYRAPGLYAPGKHPGPAGYFTPCSVDSITLDHYKEGGWKYAGDYVAPYIPSLPSSPIALSDISPSGVAKLGHWLRTKVPAMGNKEIEEEQKRIASEKALKADIKQACEDEIKTLKETCKKESRDEIVKQGLEGIEAKDTSTDGKQYCQRNECCHPARRGRYHRFPVKITIDGEPKTFSFPLVETDRRFATMETIHGSVYARYKAHVDVTKDAATEKAWRAKEDETYKGKKYVPVSLCDWKPPALFPFMYEKNEKPPAELGIYNRYRRSEIWEGGPAIWTGKCPESGLFFEMLEEPDSFYTHVGDLDDLRRDNKYDPTSPEGRSLRRMRIGDAMRKMHITPKPDGPKVRGELVNEDPREKWKRHKHNRHGGCYCGAHKCHCPTGILTPSESGAGTPTSEHPPAEQELETKKEKKIDINDPALKERFMDALYLEDGFDVEKYADMKAARLARWRDIEQGMRDGTGEGARYLKSLLFSRHIEEGYIKADHDGK